MTPHTLWSLISLSVFATLVWAQGPVQSFFPASIPLSVRSPYISVWDISTKGSNSIANSWPHFWGQQVRSPFLYPVQHRLELGLVCVVHHGLGRQDQGRWADVRLDGARRSWERPSEHNECPNHPDTIHLRYAGRPNERYSHLSFSN